MKFNVKTVKNMKKFMIIFGFSVILFILCSSFVISSMRDPIQRVEVDVRTIDGHKYIVAYSYSVLSSNPRPGGVSVIHAESCNCKRR